jgi:hypothetical protein
LRESGYEAYEMDDDGYSAAGTEVVIPQGQGLVNAQIL